MIFTIIFHVTISFHLGIGLVNCVELLYQQSNVLKVNVSERENVVKIRVLTRASAGSLSNAITKTHLFKYIENFASKN